MRWQKVMPGRTVWIRLEICERKMLDKVGQVLDEGPVDCHFWLHQLKREFVNLRACGV